MMFGIGFLTNFGRKFCVRFLNSITTIKVRFSRGSGNYPKTYFYVRNTIGKTNTNFSLKINEKRYAKHHQIDQKTSKFRIFWSIWWCLAYGFWLILRENCIPYLQFEIPFRPISGLRCTSVSQRYNTFRRYATLSRKQNKKSIPWVWDPL